MGHFFQERSSVLSLLRSQKPTETCGQEKQVRVWLYLNTLRDRPTGILDSIYSITSTFPKTVATLSFLSFLLKFPRPPVSIPTIAAVVLVFIWTTALGCTPIFPPVQLESSASSPAMALSWHSPCSHSGYSSHQQNVILTYFMPLSLCICCSFSLEYNNSLAWFICSTSFF